MRFAVLGSHGQLGRDLCPRLPGEVIPLTRAEADLTQPDQVRQTLLDVRPDVLINCAAYNFVDQAESEPGAAFAVNTWGVRDLALLCRELDLTLVHYSTDYVFGLDTKRQTPWTETDAPGPVSVYGTSKLNGEYFVRSLCPKHFVLRTCGLYGVWGSGGKGGNFVETMIRVGSRGKDLKVVADQICTPSYTVDVAQASIALIETGKFGLYHVTNAEPCSWYELAKSTFETLGIQVNLAPITTEEYGAPAARPRYSVLSLSALAELGIELRSWREGLLSYLEERERKAA